MQMPATLVTVTYLAAGILFILSLQGLSAQQSARRGNVFGMVGMLLAILATVLGPRVTDYGMLTAALAVGGGVGAVLAVRVQMTSMPQLVAILHSFVGLAAVLVGFGGTLAPTVHESGADRYIHEVETFVGVFVGALTFTGSVVAFGKLQGVIRGKPLLLPGRHLLNVVGVVACVAMGVRFLGATGEVAVSSLFVNAVVAGLIGIHLVMAIGGADMPVVVSMLNSYSGWAAAAAGFMLDNDLLIITGALVGSSGAILSYIMCRAMNRSFVSVILGGFGAEEGYVHEKIRQRGGRTLCLPFLRWLHRFERPMGVPYRNAWEDRVRNYLIGHAELGLPLEPIRQHYTEFLGEAFMQRVDELMAG